MIQFKVLKELFDALVKRIEGKDKQIAELERAAAYDRGKAAGASHARYFMPSLRGGCTTRLAAARIGDQIAVM